MASPQQGFSPEFGLGLRQMLLDGAVREQEITRRVFAAIPEDKKEYKPDASARSAWELAWHMANTDVQFLDGIADGKFSMEASEKKPTTVAELVKWYDENFARAAARVRAMSADQLVASLNFLNV